MLVSPGICRGTTRPNQTSSTRLPTRLQTTRPVMMDVDEPMPSVKRQGEEKAEVSAANKAEPAPSRMRRGDDEERDSDEAVEWSRLMEQYPRIERNKGSLDRMIATARRRHEVSGPSLDRKGRRVWTMQR